MAIIGIDLGTANSLACVYRDGRAALIPNELGEYKTSSAVSVLEDGTVLVGAAARERLVSHPESTAASFKTWMGTDRTLTLGNRRFRPAYLIHGGVTPMRDARRIERILEERLCRGGIPEPALLSAAGLFFRGIWL